MELDLNPIGKTKPEKKIYLRVCVIIVECFSTLKSVGCFSTHLA